MKSVLDGLVEGWAQQQQQQHQHSQRHLRACLRTWRLSAVHKQNELRFVAFSYFDILVVRFYVKVFGFGFLVCEVWRICCWRVTRDCSMVQLVTAAQELHDARFVSGRVAL